MPSYPHTYRDLIVWQKATDLAAIIYTLTQRFPKEDTGSLAMHMHRSAFAIPAAIAEGKQMGNISSFRKGLRTAYGAGAELETQLHLVQRIPTMTKEDTAAAEALLTEVLKMLHVLLKNTKYRAKQENVPDVVVTSSISAVPVAQSA